jgi:hypothetical protein
MIAWPHIHIGRVKTVSRQVFCSAGGCREQHVVTGFSRGTAGAGQERQESGFVGGQAVIVLRRDQRRQLHVQRLVGLQAAGDGVGWVSGPLDGGRVSSATRLGVIEIIRPAAKRHLVDHAISRMDGGRRGCVF